MLAGQFFSQGYKEELGFPGLNLAGGRVWSFWRGEVGHGAMHAWMPEGSMVASIKDINVRVLEVIDFSI